MRTSGRLFGSRKTKTVAAIADAPTDEVVTQVEAAPADPAAMLRGPDRVAFLLRTLDRADQVTLLAALPEDLLTEALDHLRAATPHGRAKDPAIAAEPAPLSAVGAEETAEQTAEESSADAPSDTAIDAAIDAPEDTALDAPPGNSDAAAAPIAAQFEPSNDEQRDNGRRLVRWRARVIFDNNLSTVDCTVTNMSGDGCALLLENTTLVPDLFRLEFTSQQKTYVAEVVWRQYNALGVRLS